jgi:uncharacterized small protein (DUF1192 family)
MLDLEESKARLKQAITADIRTAGGFLVVGKALADAADAYEEIGTLRSEVERLRAEVALRTDERNALAAQVEVYTRGVTVRLVEGNE